jgi:hypothetical protein
LYIMKRTFYALLIIINLSAYAQLNDSFDDGDITTNPTWFGNVSKFQVNNNKLFLNGLSVTDTAYLYALSSSFSNTEWAVDINMDFDPSDNNKVYIYLASNFPDISTANLSGWLLSIGENGSSDGIIVQKVVNGVRNTVARFGDGLFASKPSYTIRVRRDVTGNWELAYKLPSQSIENFSVLGTFSDNFTSSVISFGVACKYTTSNKTKFDFDNFYIGKYREDTIPPHVDSLVVVDNNILKIYFTEDVNKVTAEVLSNYNVAGIGVPSTATLDDINNNLVTLNFGNTFTPFTDYALAISNVKDLKGNAISTTITIPFMYRVINIPLVGDVVVNEIMADPSPVVGLPEIEYIEIYNRSNTIFYTQNWKFKNEGTTLYNFPSIVLQPKTYHILCKSSDSASLAAYGQVIPFATFPTFDNTGGDSVIIIDQTNQKVDAIFYDETWYADANKADGGYSIEQINPFAKCNNKNNWKASTYSDGGTPGKQNSVYDNTPDNTPPKILKTKIVNNNTIDVIFDEPLDIGALLLSHYTINNGITVFGTSFENSDKTTVRLTISTLDTNTVYTITANNIPDCSGNLSTPLTSTFAIGNIPMFNQLIITEFLANPVPPVGLPQAEYIELYNTSSKVLNLKGCFVEDATSSSSSLDEYILLPGEYVVVFNKNYESLFSSIVKRISVANFPSINNDQESISIYNINDNLVFNLQFEGSWYGSATKANGGWALEMIDTDYPCLASSNWIASVSSNGGTPAAANSVQDVNPDISSIEASSLIKINDSIYQVNFNEKFNPNAIPSAKFVIDNGIGTVVPIPILPGCSAIQFEINTTLSVGVQYKLTISDAGDCASNTIKEGFNMLTLGATEGVEPGDIVINEILFNPKTEGVDYVELYNISSKFLLLDDMIIAEADPQTPTIVNDFANIENTGIIIPPQGFFVLTEDAAKVKSQYIVPNPAAITDISGMPNYPDDEGVIILLRDDDVLLDKVNYSDNWHFQLLDIKDGVALERLNAYSPSQDSKNWYSASRSVGFGTPTGTNSSVAQPIGDDPLSVYPEVFSPDQDGFDDILNITYNLDKPSYIANMYVINTFGKVVKQVYKNELLPQSGSTIWDGVADTSEKGRIGLYFIVLEIFDTEGKKKVYRKEFGLANKLD